MALPPNTNWRLDDVAFSDYGVYVQRSQGVLDFPGLQTEGTNWLDQFGREYWQHPAELKYTDREIILSCWIHAPSWLDFVGAAAAFYTALRAPGTRTLYTPYNVVENIVVMDGISLVRETSYVRDIQAGTFSLRMTVLGDHPTKSQTIYHADGTVAGVFEIGDSMQLQQTLMGDNTVSFQIEVNTLGTIGRDDYIFVDGNRYIAFEYPGITKLSTNSYRYNCTFAHEIFRLRDIQFRKFNASEFYWWANADDILTCLVQNTDRNFQYKFGKGTVASTIYKNWQFSNESCLDVLTRLCQEYDLEWGFRYNYTMMQISVLPQIGNASEMVLSYGRGQGLYSIQRSSTPRDKIVTHLFAYGSEKNIPSTYDRHTKRLSLPEEHTPLVKPFYATVREQTVVFDDIFPRTEQNVQQYIFIPSPDPVNEPELAQHLLVTDMPYDLNKKEPDGITTTYLFSGVSAKIRMNDGACAGMEFEVVKYQHTGSRERTFWIAPIKEVNDQTFPSETIYPSNPDKFVVLDIKLPVEKIREAEALLLTRAQEYQEFYYEPHSQYNLTIEPGFDFPLYPGDTLLMSDPDFEQETLRVTDIQRNLYTGECQVTLSDIVRFKNRMLVENKIARLARVVEHVAISEVPDQIRSDKSVGEVERKIIDPIDEKFRADDIVRDESLDPRMLAYDSGVPQFSLEGLFFEVDYNEDPQSVHVTAGTLICHNWRPLTLTRKEIKWKEEEEGIEAYLPTRQWAFAEDTLTLPGTGGYHVYAIVPMAEGVTEFELFFSPSLIPMRRYFPAALYYKLGYINPSASPREVGMLWGNVKMKGGTVASPVKQFSVLVSQTATNAPNMVTLENGIGQIVATRSGVGTYLFTLAGAFPLDKTSPVDDCMFDQAGNYYTLNRLSADQMELKTYAAANITALADGILNKRYINISVYP